MDTNISRRISNECLTWQHTFNVFPKFIPPIALKLPNTQMECHIAGRITIHAKKITEKRGKAGKDKAGMIEKARPSEGSNE